MGSIHGMRGLIFCVGATLAACQQGNQQGGNSDSTSLPAVSASATECAAPALVLADGDKSLDSALMEETKANFGTAFQSACAKGIPKAKELIDPRAADRGQIFLINAPDANVASIYLSEVDGNRMVLEYPFLTADGKSQAPSVDELEEAIYCRVVGATPEEQESSGRCLVD